MRRLLIKIGTPPCGRCRHDIRQTVATVQGGFPDGLASRQKEGKRFATDAIPRSLQPTSAFAGAGRSALALSWGSTMVEFTLSVKLTVAQLVRLAKAVILLLLLV